MKRISVLFQFVICLCAHAQKPVASLPLAVTDAMTTNIIFPYRIIKADIGSGDVIGHEDPRLQHVLFLKANRKNFAPTNLSVYTSDGKFYSFILYYSISPDTLNISFSDFADTTAIRNSFPDEQTSADGAIVTNEPSNKHRKTSSQNIKMILRGVYVCHGKLWFKVELDNHSSLAFEPESFGFFIRDKHQVKRTATQEQEIIPLWRSPDNAVQADSAQFYLFALPVFPLTAEKMLVIEVHEKSAGRRLILTVRPRTILRSKII